LKPRDERVAATSRLSRPKVQKLEKAHLGAGSDGWVTGSALGLLEVPGLSGRVAAELPGGLHRTGSSGLWLRGLLEEQLRRRAEKGLQ